MSALGRRFRVLTRHRSGYAGTQMIDVQLQVVASGALVWSHTFTDADEADAYLTRLKHDLATLEDAAFRRRYSVPSRL